MKTIDKLIIKYIKRGQKIGYLNDFLHFEHERRWKMYPIIPERRLVSETYKYIVNVKPLQFDHNAYLLIP